MWRTFVSFWQIFFMIQANTFLYYLQKIPGLKRLLPDQIYRRKNMKTLACLPGALISVARSMAAQSVLLWVQIAYIPELLRKASPSLAEVSCLFLLLGCVAPVLRGSEIVSSTEEDHLFLNHFLLKPEYYYRLKTVKLMVRKILPTIPVLIYVTGDAWLAVMLSVLRLSFFVCGNSLHLQIYRLRHKLWSKTVRLTLFALILLLSYTALELGLLASIRVSAPWRYAVVVLSAVLSVVFLRFLFRFQDYKKIAVQFAGKDVIALKVSISTTMNEDATPYEMADWKDNQAFFSEHSAIEPIQYFERAFRERFRKVLFKMTKQAFWFNITVGVILGLLIQKDILHLNSENILSYSPTLILILTNMRMGANYIPLCFRYMDLPLLALRLYDRDMIVKSIKLRGILFMKHGLLALLALFLGIVALLQIGNIQVAYSEIFQIMLGYWLLLSGLELTNLSLYYLIQPYQSDLTTKSPLFSIYQGFETLISFLAVFARNNIGYFLLPFTGYFVVALVLFLLALKKAPKTFRLR